MAIILNDVRFAYLFVYTAKLQKGETDPAKARFSASLLFEPDGETHKQVIAEIERVAEEKWGARASGILKKLYAENKVCLRKGDTVTDRAGEPNKDFVGRMFLRTSSGVAAPPVVLTRQGAEVTPETKGVLDRSDGTRSPRSGDYGQAKVNIWAQDNEFGIRVNAQILGVAFRRAGDAMGREEETADSMAQSFGGNFDKSMME